RSPDSDRLACSPIGGRDFRPRRAGRTSGEPFTSLPPTPNRRRRPPAWCGTLPTLYRMPGVDADGSLSGSSRRVTPRVKAAVRSALDAGVLITLATGRWFRSAQPVAADLGLELPIILHNGALVKDSLTGEILDHCHLPLDLAAGALEIIGRHGLQPIVYGNAFAGEWLLAGPPELDTPSTARYLSSKEGLRRVPLGALLAEGEPLELVVAEVFARAEPLVADLGRGPWRTVTSMSLAAPEARLVEILAPECSKTNAIRRLG